MDNEKKEKTPKELRSENNMNFAKKINSAISSIDELQDKIKSRKKVTTEQIANLMSDPNKNATALQQQEEIMRACNGILREIIFYKSNILTYDHFLVARDMSKYKKKAKLEKDYLKAVIELDKYNIKAFCRWVEEEVIRKGEVYTYKQVGDNITYFRIPNQSCKITHMDGMMQGYAIKLDDITNDTLPAYPTDIQKIYTKYKNGQLKNDPNLLKNNYYKLPIGNAVAFTVDLYESKNAPYYASLLLDLSRIGDLNDLNMETALSDNFKLIHQLLPSEDGEINIDFETADMYHRALKNELPQGVGGLSSPYPLTALTLNSNNTSTNYSYLTQLKNNLYNSSGVDSSLFNSENRSSTQSVVYASIIDSLFAFNLLERIKIWLNYDFLSNSALKNFKIEFCDSTYYNKDSKAQNAINQATTWFSRLEMLALQGYTPLDAYNILKMESIMDFDEYITPLMNSHTMSGEEVKENGDKGGRPTASEESGDPNRVPEADNAGDY